MSTLLICGLMALALLGAVGGFVAYERHAGADSVRAELQPKLTACTTQLTTQNAAIEAMRQEQAKKQAESAKALAKAEVRAKVWDDQSKRLQAALTARKPDGPQDCKSAWAEIRK